MTTAFAAQEDLATRQCRALLGEGRYRRLDSVPSAHQSATLALDRVDPRATDTLLALAEACHADLAGRDEGRWVHRFLSHRTKPARTP